MKHLFIATPTYDSSVSAGYATSLALTVVACTAAKIAVSGPVFKGGPYIECNRNVLVHHFLASGADTMLFIDADVDWDASAVVKLYESDLEVVGGAYPKKQDAVAYPVKLLERTVGGYLAAMYLPGGFLMIRRCVFERMAPETVHYADEQVGGAQLGVYFQNLHTAAGFCGEDVYFCCKWRTLGGTVWLAPDIDFGHQGPREWRGNYARQHAPALGQGEDGTRRAA